MELQGKEPTIMKNGTYEVDLFNENPIFFVNDKYFVRDWNEAFCPSWQSINRRYKF